MNRGQIAISSLLSLAAVVSAIGVPFIWGGKVDSANAVQDVKIENTQQQIQEMKKQYETLNAKMDALLLRQGIDPAKITLKGQ